MARSERCLQIYTWKWARETWRIPLLWQETRNGRCCLMPSWTTAIWTMISTAHILFQVTTGYTWLVITKGGTILMSLSPAKAWFFLLIQTKPVEHRTDSWKLCPCLGKASRRFDTKIMTSVPRKAKQHTGQQHSTMCRQRSLPFLQQLPAAVTEGLYNPVVEQPLSSSPCYILDCSCKGLMSKDMLKPRNRSIISSFPMFFFFFFLSKLHVGKGTWKETGILAQLLLERQPCSRNELLKWRKLPSKDHVASGVPGPLMATTTILNLKDEGRSQCQEQPNQHRKYGKRGGLFSHKPYNPGDRHTYSKMSLFSLDHFNSAAWFYLATWSISVPAVQHAINRSHICRLTCRHK